ncbi:hypothetical protein JI721_09215 [Alicyclobacillus cycloheptanicus]|uniref:Membrane protein n=1 Tax=Alicyclobacillus cycloheptanicus TaxID=1457 RepID=A0ABT9XH72_9BACL|nr:hypothetical protein [Alicyclobacillus cycloheptanicus]MDQ0189651.1 putative membrane protein [Alicyclobacillus cycloheptanicus]WDM03119.1 hypothetical protein JI721_09215 [Alicyclobacillus cycloheptanicus]
MRKLFCQATEDKYRYGTVGLTHILHHHGAKGVWTMYGVFGGYTRWAVVFLIIFVLFFLLVPGYGGAAGY